MKTLSHLGGLVAFAIILASCSTGGRPGNGGGGGTAMCVPTCNPTEICCDQPSGAVCANPVVSPNHCGRCNNPCTGACVGGVCQTGPAMPDSGSMTPPPGEECSPTCSSNQRCCGATCVNRQFAGADGRTDSSFMNCNGCGLACDPERANRCGASGSSVGCLCGSGPQCVGTRVCASSGSAYLCVDLQTDNNNCGEVGNACNPGETCVRGVCSCGSTGGACAEGQACCGGGCINASSDPMNCGACGTVCGANAPHCSAGACTCMPAGRACNPTPMGMGGLPIPIPGADLGESCCASGCVANTDASCACTPCDTGAGESCITPISLPGLPGSGAGSPSVCCSTSFLCGGLPGM